MTIIVTVPIAPPSDLLPNKRHRRGGLYKGIAAAQDSRAAAKYAAMNVANGSTISGPVHLTIHVAFGYKRVTPDLDGTISAVKPMIDGLADAGLIRDDDQIVKITATQEKLRSTRRERATGYTRLTIEELPQ